MRLNDYKNLVVLQTFSKAWGMAGLRLGMAFANQEIIQVLNNIKYPYNVNGLTQSNVLNALDNVVEKEKMVSEILEQKEFLKRELTKFDSVEKVFPSDANFLLVRFKDSKFVFNKLLEMKIIVRDRSSLINCENCLRITIGTEKENQALINALKKIG